MAKIDNMHDLTSQSPMLLRIRAAALDKAFIQVRDKRFDLDDAKNRGRVSEEEYQRKLVELILEGSEIRSEKKRIEELLNI